MNKFINRIVLGLLVAVEFIPRNVYAFSKLTNGFETITRTYLIPLSGAVAGASFILFVTLSYFKQEEYQKKVANVLVLSIFTGCGLELVTNVIQSFS
jgi:hypothetical protein